MKRLIFTLGILFILENLYAQDSVVTYNKILTKEQAIEDYKILYSSLINYHPNPFSYVSESDLKENFEVQLSNMPDNLSELELHYISRQLISKIKCGHITAKPSKEWYALIREKNYLLPFEVKIIDKKLFVSNTNKDTFQLDINDEILSINNVKTEEILQKMSSIQQRDGHTESFLLPSIEKNFRTYLLFIMGTQSDYLIEYKTNSGEIKKETVKSTNKKLKELNAPNLPPDFKKIVENKWSIFCYDSTSNLAYLKISTFSDRKEFRKYYKSVFKFLNQQSNSKLIIDLRDNGGGYFGNGNNLLTYLTPNKFNFNFEKPRKVKLKNEHVRLSSWVKWTKRAFATKPPKHFVKGKITESFSYKPNKKYLYKGEVNVITNGITFSQSALVASQLNEYNATFFGEETGGTEIGCYAVLNYELVLPNSSIVVSIPMYQVKSNSTKGEFGYGVKPNYPIFPNLDFSIDHTLIEAIKIILSK